MVEHDVAVHVVLRFMGFVDMFTTSTLAFSSQSCSNGPFLYLSLQTTSQHRNLFMLYRPNNNRSSSWISRGLHCCMFSTADAQSECFYLMHSALFLFLAGLLCTASPSAAVRHQLMLANLIFVGLNVFSLSSGESDNAKV